jgi:hypothetical protein
LVTVFIFYKFSTEARRYREKTAHACKRGAGQTSPQSKTFEHPLRSSREDRKGGEQCGVYYAHGKFHGHNKRHDALEEFSMNYADPISVSSYCFRKPWQDSQSGIPECESCHIPCMFSDLRDLSEALKLSACAYFRVKRVWKYLCIFLHYQKFVMRPASAQLDNGHDL